LSILIFKLLATPILIALVTLAARRWGPAVGGWFVGLPLTSGPVSVFLAIEQGRAFAATSARASILGLVAVAVFSTTYALVARRQGPAICLVAGFMAYAVATVLIRSVNLSISGTAAFTVATLCVALIIVPRTPSKPREGAPPRWDLPLRMATATVIVLLITTSATTLGPAWSGLLSPFPVFSSVLAAFAHYTGGFESASSLQRGVLIGVFAFAAFFVVVAANLETHGLLVTYVFATLAAFAVNAVSLVAIFRA
jgi:hypothetical protein